MPPASCSAEASPACLRAASTALRPALTALRPTPDPAVSLGASSAGSEGRLGDLTAVSDGCRRTDATDHPPGGLPGKTCATDRLPQTLPSAPGVTRAAHATPSKPQ